MTQPYIYLGYYHGHSIAVSDEAYAQITAIIEAGKVCTSCQSHYDTSNPEMARNVCLQCFLKDENRRNLTYVGPLDIQWSTGDYRYQTLIDTKGYLYKISPDLSQEREQRDEALTMRHWGFHVPTQAIRDGEVTLLHDSEWSIFGDIHNPVIVARNYHSRLHDAKTFAFLLYKDREPRELNKRKGDARSLFLEAKQRIEATKDGKGYYRAFDGHEFCCAIEDYHCYPWIARIEMEQLASSILVTPERKRPAEKPKVEVEASKAMPVLSDASMSVAWEKMRPWERALWKDALGTH